MVFSSSAVSAEWNQNNFVLKRGTSMLVIEAKHVLELRTLKDRTLFEPYFRGSALQNREARRVFESWERKDTKLFDAVYSEILS